MNIKDFQKLKQDKSKITMITCYDYTSAQIIEQTQINCVLVGDTLSMLMHGFNDTVHATMEMMVLHTQAVARGLKSKFIVGDLPFMSYRKNQTDTMKNVQALIQAGAHAIKLEGAQGNLATIRHIVDSGVPVMGHIGLTPQHINNLGGFKVQGKTQGAYQQLIQQALDLEQAGCFAVVIECVPSELAKEISETLNIPTIGIGAGPNTDGQVLVWQDLLGLQSTMRPKFLKQYCQAETLFTQSINQYVSEVQAHIYPGAEHAYSQ